MKGTRNPLATTDLSPFGSNVPNFLRGRVHFISPGDMFGCSTCLYIYTDGQNFQAGGNCACRTLWIKVNEDLYVIHVNSYVDDEKKPFLPITVEAFQMVLEESEIIFRQDWQTYTIASLYAEEEGSKVHEKLPLFQRLFKKFGAKLYVSGKSEPYRRFQLNNLHKDSKKYLSAEVEMSFEEDVSGDDDVVQIIEPPTKSQKTSSGNNSKKTSTSTTTTKKKTPSKSAKSKLDKMRAKQSLPNKIKKTVDANREVLQQAADLCKGKVTIEELEEKQKSAIFAKKLKDPPPARTSVSQPVVETATTANNTNFVQTSSPGHVSFGSRTSVYSPPPPTRYATVTTPGYGHGVHYAQTLAANPVSPSPGVNPMMATSGNEPTHLRIQKYVQMCFDQGFVGETLAMMKPDEALTVVRFQLETVQPPLTSAELMFFSHTVLNNLRGMMK